MSKIFISHSSADNAKALAFAQWLEQHGWAEYFLDITPSRGLFPGERWREALITAADRCEAVVCLISPAWCSSRWCRDEFFQARRLGKPVFGVMIEHTPRDRFPEEMTAEWQLCDLVTGEEQQRFHVVQDQIVPPIEVSLAGAGLARLKQGLQKTGLDPTFFPWPPRNDPDRLPYRGLKALEGKDAAVFYGREAPLVRALDTLRRMAERREQLFVILGASGAGKSSFLRAGLWPRLQRDDRNFLPLPVLRPERTAIHGQSGLLKSLEKTFCDYQAPKMETELRAILRERDGLVELMAEIQTRAQKRLGPEAALPTILIGIDQAEELFSKEAGEEAGQLLEHIGKFLGLVTGAQPMSLIAALRVIVLVTIRSDSYERLQTEPMLAGIRQIPFNLPPLAAAEYKMVIEGPATRATAAGRRLTIEPTLTEQLLQDTNGADALPLLAFILERLLIKYGVIGMRKFQEYEDLGGLQGAIETALNEAWKDPDHDPVIPADAASRTKLLYQAFPSLIMLDHATEKPARRVATLDLLPAATHPLLQRLVEARLLLKDRRKLTNGQEAVVVEVAHEALIQHWPLLSTWVDTNREFLVWKQRLSTTLRKWDESRRPIGLLLHGLPLREAIEWFTKRAEDDFSPEERLFITASMARRRRSRITLAAITGCVLLVTGMTIWLWGYSPDQATLKVQSLFRSIHRVPEMQPVAAGRFQQGDAHGGGQKDEKPVHEVTIKPFAMAKFEVTFDEYDRFALATGRLLPGDQGWGRGRRPVINVSWHDAKAYAAWLSQQTGKRYRLPTESEWEYAARSAGKDDLWPGTSNGEELKKYAVYAANRTAPIGHDQGRKPNAIGLYDMSGNVLEWVEDCLHDTYESAPTDGIPWLEGGRGDCQDHMNRGGSWYALRPETLRASRRFSNLAYATIDQLGFRLALDIVP